ncbi:MAG: plasmid mobilization relaxosome protein MobC [Pelagimonas sp.]
MTDAEYDAIEDMAVSCGLPTSTYVRTFVLSGEPLQPKISDIDAQAVVALNRIGALLNQIARVANSTGEVAPADIDHIRHAIAQLDDLKTQISGDTQ